jgi:predicted RNA-binding Zn-ribbon protein involved in translation (DUF1610 family)
MLPWWVGVVAAIGLYIGLHAYASQVAMPITPGAQLGASVSQTIFRTLASIFQYILPVVCLAAAGASAWKSSQRKSLAQGVTASGSASSLDGMTWQEFARGRNVTLVDGDKLFAMLQAARAGIRKGASATGAQVGSGASALACPACGSAMVKRVAKRGANAGNAFWGCSEFPKCRGTVPR